MATYTTKQQKAVLDCLSERADSPVSAAAIVDALREQGEHIGIATVYRQLEKLEMILHKRPSRMSDLETVSTSA
mgnify:CR=1 FL=1